MKTIIYSLILALLFGLTPLAMAGDSARRGAELLKQHQSGKTSRVQTSAKHAKKKHGKKHKQQKRGKKKGKKARKQAGHKKGGKKSKAARKHRK